MHYALVRTDFDALRLLSESGTLPMSEEKLISDVLCRFGQPHSNVMYLVPLQVETNAEADNKDNIYFLLNFKKV